jgi:hypothetical protein
MGHCSLRWAGKGLAHGQGQLACGKGLGQNPHRAEGFQAVRGYGPAEAGDEHDGQTGGQRPQLLGKRQTADSGHVEIGDEQVAILRGLAQGLQGGLGSLVVVTW